MSYSTNDAAKASAEVAKYDVQPAERYLHIAALSGEVQSMAWDDDFETMVDPSIDWRAKSPRF